MLFKKESEHTLWKKQHDLGLTQLQPYYKKLDKRNQRKIGKGSTLMYNAMSNIPHRVMIETGMPEELYQAAWGQSLYTFASAAYSLYVGHCTLEEDRRAIQNWTELEHKICDGGVVDTYVKEKMSTSLPFGDYVDRANNFCVNLLYAIYQMNQEEGLNYTPSELIRTYEAFAPDIINLWQEASKRLLTTEEYQTLTNNCGFYVHVLTTEHDGAQHLDTRQWIFTHNPIDWACEFVDFLWNKYQLAFDVMYRHGVGIDVYHREEELRHGEEHRAKYKALPQEYKEVFATMGKFSTLYPVWAIFEFFGWDEAMIRDQLPDHISTQIDKIIELRDEWDRLQQINWYEGQVAEDWWI